MPGFVNWVSGQILNASDLMRLPQQDIVLKAADQNIASNVSPVDDTHLFMSVAANTKYWVEGFIIYTGPTAADIQFTWSFPAGCTFRWTNDAIFEPPGVAGDIDRRCYTGSDLVLASTITGFDLVALPRGVLQVAGTAGTLRFRWCQWASNATACVVKTNSMLRLTKVS
ncbi:hypothetical protein [Nonomuraea sp. NPDC050202]|uniref:hypothetical protein n=1 Tax=Nonomuraea sp. NPDC050202 TaxID=3155035 RepID=UPI0033F35849